MDASSERRLPVSRRQVAALLFAAPVAAQVTTSSVPPAGSPAPAQAAASSQDKLQKAYADVRQVSDRLSKIDVPMSIEPAFSFRA